MDNRHLLPFLHEQFEQHKAHVEQLDRAGLSFRNMIQDLKTRFGLSATEAKIVLMLVFPNYH
jgi:hypothetical protein